MTYQLQPGTIPYRVFNWLRLQPAGAEFSSSVIAEELGIEPANIVPCLKTPHAHGVIHGRQDDRRLWYWSLGNGVPRAKHADDELEQSQVEKPKHKAQKALPVVLSATPDAQHFRVGRFSDGSLLIEAGGKSLALKSEQAKILVAFITGGQH